MVVYIDVLLFENFIVNLFLLMLTGRLLKIKRVRKQEILAAALGASYAIVMVVPSLETFSSFPFKLITAVGMVFISQGNFSFKNLVSGTVIFILLSFLLSGICFGLSLYQNSFAINSRYILSRFPINYIIVPLLIVYIAMERIIDIIKDKLFVSSYIFDLTVKLNNLEIKTKGFLDTGNELKDPVTNLPVIILEKSLYSFLHLDYKELMYINFKAVDGFSGILKGIKVKEIIIENEKGRMIRDAIVCFTDHSLTQDGEYRALLSRGIV